MKRFIGVSIFLMLSAIAVHALSRTSEYEYYRRGIFISVDFAAGAAFNERTADRGRNSSNGTDIALGYRFSPYFALAIGSGAHGYSNRTWTCEDTVPRKVENTCVTLFVRIRSDLMDREVSPYLQMDLGYSFMEMYTRDALGRVHYAPERLPNGRHEYMDLDDSYIQYGMKGCFASLDLGVSLQIIGRTRMNIGLCGGLHQAFLGTSFSTEDGHILYFGRADYLTSEDGNHVQVRTLGSPAFKETLEPFLRVKISFSF